MPADASLPDDQTLAAIVARVARSLGLPVELPPPPSVLIDAASLDFVALAALIDHTLLRPDATAAEIDALCEEALTYGFAAVCVQPMWVARCAAVLRGSKMRIASVVGFPLGVTLAEVKRAEAEQLLARGAAELDMVLNIGALKSGDLALVYADIGAVAEVTRAGGAVLKVILETGYLTAEEKVAACVLARAAGADFVKTATGLGPGGATAADVRLMRRVVGDAIGVKAAGGVRTLEQMLEMVRAGANRIGTSAGVRIMQEARRPVEQVHG